jgi:hypothetical protein
MSRSTGRLVAMKPCTWLSQPVDTDEVMRRIAEHQRQVEELRAWLDAYARLN